MDGNSPASFSTYGERGTFDLGRELGPFLTLPFCVGLRVTLGVGKTVMVKGIADGLGIKDTVTSPTYTFCREYRDGGRKLTHIDLYRIDNVDDLESIGWLDLVLEADILVVEWIERAAGYLPRDWIDVELVLAGGDKRSATFRSHGRDSRQILTQLETSCVGHR